jgi:hypothetical protein
MMAAPTNNKFWELRSKHGRDKIFSSAEVLKQECFEYFNSRHNNPLIEIDFKGKDAIEVEIPKMRPFTLTGLFVYLGINRQTWENYKTYEGFADTIEEIENIIYTQKFEGAAAGFLNPSIIARDLGLVDKREIENKDNLSTEERDKRIKELVSKLGGIEGIEAILQKP